MTSIDGRIRDLLRRRVPTIGCFTGLESSSAAELLGCIGFDWVVIESEHNGIDLREIEQMLMALSATDAAALVRVPSAEPMGIQRVLDLGAAGVVVPRVETVAEAAAVIRATRYPPEGERGFGPLRAGRYGVRQRDYFERANENVV